MIAFIISVLVVIIAGLLVFIAYTSETARKEREKLTNAIIARNSSELRDLTLADKTHIDVKPNEDMPDLIPENQLGQEDWEKAIHEQITNEA